MATPVCWNNSSKLHSALDISKQKKGYIVSHSHYNITGITGDINVALTLTGLQNSYLTISILEFDHQLYQCNVDTYLMISGKGKLCDQQERFDVYPTKGSVSFQLINDREGEGHFFLSYEGKFLHIS